MAKKQNPSISSILIGDTLAEMATQLDIGEGEANEAKLIVILLEEAGTIRLVASGDINKAELVGALYMAIDRAASGGTGE